MGMGPTTILNKKAKCTAAIATAYTIGKPGADDDHMSVAAAATDALLCIFQHTTAAANDTVDCKLAGSISDLKLGGTVTRGDRITSDANACGITATLGQSVIGIITKSGVSGDIKPCLILPQVYAPNQGVDGLNLLGTARATYDFDVDGGAVSSIGLGVTIPANSVITKAWFDIITVFTSTGDNGTIALNAEGAGDLLAAVDADTLSAGPNAGIPVGTAATMVKTTIARELTITIATNAILSGKLILFVEYVKTLVAT